MAIGREAFYFKSVCSWILNLFIFLHYLSSVISGPTCNLCTFRSQIKGAIYLLNELFHNYILHIIFIYLFIYLNAHVN